MENVLICERSTVFGRPAAAMANARATARLRAHARAALPLGGSRSRGSHMAPALTSPPAFASRVYHVLLWLIKLHVYVFHFVLVADFLFIVACATFCNVGRVPLLLALILHL